MQETDDEQDAKQIVVIEYGPGEERPADKNELKVRELTARRAAARLDSWPRRLLAGPPVQPPSAGQAASDATAAIPGAPAPAGPLQELLIQDLKTEDLSREGGYALRRVGRGSVVLVRGPDAEGETVSWVALVKKVGGGAGGGCVVGRGGGVSRGRRRRHSAGPDVGARARQVRWWS